MARPAIDYFVLDALANDLEGLDDILRLVNRPDVGWVAEAGTRIEAAAVLLALPRLMRDHLIQVFVPSADTSELDALPAGVLPAVPLEECYFGLTTQGRLVHGNWSPESGTE